MGNQGRVFILSIEVFPGFNEDFLVSIFSRQFDPWLLLYQLSHATFPSHLSLTQLDSKRLTETTKMLQKRFNSR
jgi:hypothetical protein